MDTPARRKPNLSLTEADWLAVMDAFLAGASDAELGRRWAVSPSTVAAQRFKRGVMRRDRAAPSVAAQQAAAAARVAEVAEARAQAEAGRDAGALRLVLPEGCDPVAACDAILAHSRRLFAEGRTEEAVAAARLSRSHLLALRARRAVVGGRASAADEDGEAEAEEPPPVLRPAQTPPPGDWRTWLFLGGRGAGKTLAGAAWLAGRARTVGRLALVGPTYADVREVMIEGASGLRGAAAGFGPEGGRPAYEPSRRRLVWPNGAVAGVFTAEDPDGLRGPQFAAAWADELCAWPRTPAKGPEETLAMLRMGLRLGGDPRLAITTTPRPTAGLARLLAEDGLAVTRGSAVENAAWLAPGFVEGLRALYGGTRLERQEIDGEVLEAAEGAVFRRAEIERARRLGSALPSADGGGKGEGASDGPPPRFEALVVGVDPPAGLDGAACGIVVAGRAARRAWVLEDATAHGLTPLGWAGRVRAAAERAAARGPVRVVAEANQGGEMVRQVLGAAGLAHPVRLVHATAGKAARAEPVALLYEQGRVAHLPGLEPLEDQLLLLGAAGRDVGAKSPDRADALVWALTALMLERNPTPRVRML